MTLSPTTSQIEIGTVTSQVRLSAMPDGLSPDTRFVGLEDISAHLGQIDNISYVTDVKSRVFGFKNGDVLYSRLRPYLRKAALADFDGYGSGEIIVLRCSDRILPRYLLTLLLSEDFTNFVTSRTRGDRPRTSHAVISKYRFELPSLEIQAEICRKDIRFVNSLSKLDEATDRIECDAEALLGKMQTELVWETSPESTLVPLTELVESIDYGTSKKSSYGGVGMPILRIPNVAANGEINVEDLKYSPLSAGEIERYQLNAGDILIIRSNGSLSLVARAAKVNYDHEGYAFAGYLLRLRPHADVLSDYLLHLIASPSFRRLVETAARSSTGINNLSAGRLATFVVPKHPVSRQEQIVSTLVRLQDALIALKTSMNLAQGHARALHEAARRDWLGQNGIAEAEFTASPEAVEVIKRDQITPILPPLDASFESALRRQLDAAPKRAYSFAELFEGFNEDYDDARQVVFEMLSSNPPSMVQVFDKKTKSIQLRRPV